MGVSKNDVQKIAEKTVGENYFQDAARVGDWRTMITDIIVEDWNKNCLTPAERVAIRMINTFHSTSTNDFPFDSDDIVRNCSTCRNVTDDGADCSIYATHGTCHVSIPNLWQFKED